jgi:hypothetical protein
VRLADGSACVRTAVPPDLFAACIGIVFGYPGTLGEWRASSQAAIWDEATTVIARQPTDPLFDAAFSRVIQRAKRIDPNFIDCLTEAARINADAVFEHLLERSIYDGAVARAEHWQALLRIGPADGSRDRWFDRMALVAPEIVDSALSLKEWMLQSSDRQRVEARLSADYRVYQSLVLVLKVRETIDQLPADPLDGGGDVGDVDEAIVLSSFAELAVRLIQTKPPRFLRTVDDASGMLKRQNLLTADRAAALATVRELLVSTQSSERDAYSEADRARFPTDWVNPA